VVRVPLGPDASPLPIDDEDDALGSEEVFPGSGNPVGYVVDEAAKRIHIRVHTPLGASLLTFDGTQKAYVGSQPVSTRQGAVQALPFGLDPTTGRVYVQSTESNDPDRAFGLTMIDGRRPTTDQRLTFWDYRADFQPPRVLPRDPVYGRLFPVRGPGTSPQDQVFIAIHDAPPVPEPPPPDPDANTKDVEEEAGLTRVDYSSDASGYGVRIIVPGGAAGLIPERATQPVKQAVLAWDDCHSAQRELSLARIRDVKLYSSLRGARSISAEADPNTVLDVAQPSRCTDRPGFGTNADGTPAPVEQSVRDLEDTVYEDVPSQVANTANEASVPRWITNIVKQHLGPAYEAVTGDDDPFGETDDDEGTIECTSTRDEDGDCLSVDETADEAVNGRTGRDWPFTEASCSAGTFAHTQPGFDAEAFQAEMQEDPLSRSEQDPLDAGLTSFQATSDCRESAHVSASAVAELPPLSIGGAIEEAAGMSPVPIAGAPEVVGAAAGGLPTITVVHASTAATHRLDPKRGLVSTVESLTRGIEFTIPGRGVIHIGGVYARAGTWAKGRPGTAGTSYDRMLWGVRIVDAEGNVLTCDVCAGQDQIDQIIDAINAVLGDRGKARAPRPDAVYAAGTPGGYQAAIQLDEFQKTNNFVVNGDDTYEVASLEITMINDSSGEWGRQRQIFQFAGVKANSAYAVGCMAGGQVVGKTCVIPELGDGGVEASLVDGDGQPLAGAEFSLSGGPTPASCTTAADGRCAMLDVEPGSYTVTETKSPDGYLTSDPVQIEVFPESVASVNFVNLRNAGTILITLKDASSAAPLEGGVFNVYSDTDGVLAPTDPLFAQCRTDAGGQCLLTHVGSGVQSNDVPLGGYIAKQADAPSGYEAIADAVPFTLELAGQVANLDFTNGTGAEVLSNVTGGQGNPQGFQTIADGGDSGGGGPANFLQDLFDEFRNFLLRSPGEALLFGASLLLFGAPFWASWRRRLLLGATSTEI
ncbi:MAG TPA: SpaA isopeptide-forming pilin-related protein, partial [Acidimicrobiia bacterium]|nr:SpaA isopeptide-forming pilin-related protein [Acidimicrobiia bacterium]